MMRAKLLQTPRGAVHPGVLDVVLVGALTALLLYAAWRQFPAYKSQSAPATSPVVQPTH